MTTPLALLQLAGFAKSFPGVRALSGVDLRVEAGQAHALLSENGAGKSTLLRILAGAMAPDAGEVRIAGAVVRLATPCAAKAASIGLIHQELQLVPEVSVAQTMFLSSAPRIGPFTDRAAMHARARAALAQLGTQVDPRLAVRELSIAQRQMVEVARAHLWNARVVAMDDQTSSLARQEFTRLVGVIERLQAQGVGVIYVSHKLGEVFSTCSRATVLRDGMLVGAVDLASPARAGAGYDGVVAMLIDRAARGRGG